MYRATLNGETFFDTTAGDESYSLISALVEIKAGSAGTFTFEVPPTNKAYDSFHMLTDFIDIYRDDIRIFSCRIYSVEDTFDGTKNILCEGLLAVLNDSIFRPVTFDDTLWGLVDDIITSHNGQVGTEKQIVGGISGTIPDQDVYRDYQDYDTSLSRLLDLQSTFGGYMFAYRRGDGKIRFDWQDYFTAYNGQTINFGENLLDLTREVNGTDIFTVLIPLGAQQDDGSRLTIESVNEGKDYIEADPEVIAQYGRITKVCVWDDVTEVLNLLAKGEAYLTESLVEKITIHVTAVDLADAGYDIEAFKVGELVSVTSPPHGLYDERLELKEQTLNLLNPAANRLVLGTEKKGYIQSSSREVVQEVEKVVSNITKIRIVDGNRVGYLSSQMVASANSDVDGAGKKIDARMTPGILSIVETDSNGDPQLRSYMSVNSNDESAIVIKDSDFQTRVLVRDSGTIVTYDANGDGLFQAGSDGRLVAHSSAGDSGYVPIMRYKDISGATNAYGGINLGLYVEDRQFVIGFQHSSSQSLNLTSTCYMGGKHTSIYGQWYAEAKDNSGNLLANTNVAFRVLYLQV